VGDDRRIGLYNSKVIPFF